MIRKTAQTWILDETGDLDEHIKNVDTWIIIRPWVPSNKPFKRKIIDCTIPKWLENLPKLEFYDKIGDSDEHVEHMDTDLDYPSGHECRQMQVVYPHVEGSNNYLVQEVGRWISCFMEDVRNSHRISLIEGVSRWPRPSSTYRSWKEWDSSWIYWKVHQRGSRSLGSK